MATPKKQKVKDDFLDDGVDTFSDEEIVHYDAIPPTDDDIQDELDLMGTYI